MKKDWTRDKASLANDKREWLKLKERQEWAIATKSEKIKSLEAEFHSFFVNEKNCARPKTTCHLSKVIGEYSLKVITIIVEMLTSTMYILNFFCGIV